MFINTLLPSYNTLAVLQNFMFILFYRSKTDPVTGAVKNTKYHQL